MKSFFSLLPAAAFFASLPAASAQTPTNTVGYMTFTLPATTAAAATDYFSVPLKPSKLFSGSPTTVGTNTITVATASWTSGAFAGATPYYVYIQSGSQAGRILHILANTTTQLTVDVTDDSAQTTNLNTAGFALATTDTIEIRAGYTLGTFFGTTAATIPLTLTGTPDKVYLWNWKTSQFEAYQFLTGSVNHWVKSDNTNQNNLPLPPNATIAVARPANHPAAQFIVTGDIPTVAPLVKTGGGSTPRYYGLEVPADVTFSKLNLGVNWTKSNSVFTADTVSLYNNALAKWEAYYEKTDGTWLKSGSATSQNTTVIPAGSSLVFTRRTAVSGSSSFTSIALPYTP